MIPMFVDGVVVNEMKIDVDTKSEINVRKTADEFFFKVRKENEKKIINHLAASERMFSFLFLTRRIDLVLYIIVINIIYKLKIGEHIKHLKSRIGAR